MDKAKATCPEGLKLHTLQENMPARAFYERHNFQVGKLSINKINNQPNVEYYWMPQCKQFNYEISQSLAAKTPTKSHSKIGS